jgi:hypothetical protein
LGSNVHGEVGEMKEEWEETILCATQCSRCRGGLDRRILSVYDHQVICMECKKEEEERPDYDEVSKNMIRQCMVDTERQYGDRGGSVITTSIPTPADRSEGFSRRGEFPL